MKHGIERFLQSLEAKKNVSPNTVFAYRNDLTQFATFLSAVHPAVPMREALNTPQLDSSVGESTDSIEMSHTFETPLDHWGALTGNHLTSYLLYLRGRGYASSTVARKTAAIKSFCQFLVAEGDLANDPAAAMGSPKVDKSTPRAMTHEQVHRLLLQPGKPESGSPSRPEAVRDRAMLETLYETGMRVSELVALDCVDVDLEGCCLRCASRTPRERSLPVGGTVVRSLRMYLNSARPGIPARDDVALFLNHRGNRLTRQGFWLILKSYAAQAGIADITPHTLRHTYAAHALDRGQELADVQRILGHVSISTTQVYRRLALEIRETGDTVWSTQSSPDRHRIDGSVDFPPRAR